MDVDISEQDVLDFNLYHMRHSDAAKRQRRLVALVPAGIWIGIWTAVTLLSENPRAMMPLLLPALLGGIVYALVVLFRWEGSAAKTVSRFLSEGSNRSILGAHRLTVERDGLWEESPVSTTRYDWKAIERVAETPDHIFLYTNAVTAIIVPRRSFTSQEDFLRFRETVAVQRRDRDFQAE